MIRWFLCLVGMHEWTCAAGEGIGPRELPEVRLLMDQDKHIEAFELYATMYCGHCGKVHERKA